MKPLPAFLFCFIFALAPAHAGIEGQARALVTHGDLRATRTSLYAIELGSDRPLVEMNADEPMIPASNMKLITSAAALATLGPDFLFRTELRFCDPQAGESSPSLVVVGDGDPAFGDNKVLEPLGGEISDLDKLLDLWVRKIKQTGAMRIATLWVDDRVFDRQFTHPTWEPNDLSKWFAAQVAGLNINTNCLDIYPQPQAQGESPLVSIYPTAPFISTTNQALSGGADTFWVWRRQGSNDLVFRGRIKSKRRVLVNVTVHDPPMFFGQLLAHRLGEAGVRVDTVARPDDQRVLPRGQTLHVVQTGLRAVMARCNKDSQNLYAEALLKRMGHRLTGAPGSWESGAATVRLFLNQTLGAGASIVRVADGSGLSRDNRVTARALVGLLKTLQQDSLLGPVYLQSLSVAGADGTLDHRLNRDLAGQVYAKSGYIRQVSTLSGYLVMPADEDRPAGRIVAFSFLFNDIDPNVPLARIKTVQDELVRLIDNHLSPRPVGPRIGG